MEWVRILAYITGSVDEELLLRNEYLATENRILRAQIKGRLLLSDAEKKKHSPKLPIGSVIKRSRTSRTQPSQTRLSAGIGSSSPVSSMVQRHDATLDGPGLTVKSKSGSCAWPKRISGGATIES